MLGYLLFIWWLDLNEREPLKLVFIHFIWGAVGAVILGLIWSISLHGITKLYISNESIHELTGTILIAPVVEEITKGMFLLIMLAYRSFDNITDGFVYGGAIGLGFGMSENFLYFITAQGDYTFWLYLVVVRTFLTALIHCSSTAFFGITLGYAKFKPKFQKYIIGLMGLFSAIIIHSVWNASVSFSDTFVLGIVYGVFVIFLMFVLFISSIYLESKIIRRELGEESENKFFNSKYLPIIPYYTLRRKKGWIEEGSRKEYIRTATQLAFRKMQWKQLKPGWRKEVYKNEIDFLRDKISKMDEALAKSVL
jgi:RsiW-degrading membrane proteinase PrsW (M82 family)